MTVLFIMQVSSLNSLQMIQRSNFTDLLAEGILDLSSCELLQSIKQLRINSFSTGEVSSTNVRFYNVFSSTFVA